MLNPTTAPSASPGTAASPLENLARGYVPLSPESRAQALRSGTVAVDANVLLSLYRYSRTTRDQLLSVLESLRPRLFVPHQAASEYFRNRANVLITQLTATDQMRSRLDKAFKMVESELERFHADVGRRDGEQATEKARGTLDRLRADLIAGEEARLGASDLASDDIHPRLVTILEGRVGAPYGDDELSKLRDQAESRYAAEIPPGYLDADKDHVEHAYGDAILWFQLLDHAERVGHAVVLVTDDQKDDWVWTIHGRRLGPRPELVREMHARAGVDFHLLTPAAFLNEAARLEDTKLSSEAINEVRDVSAKLEEERASSPTAGPPDPFARPVVPLSGMDCHVDVAGRPGAQLARLFASFRKPYEGPLEFLVRDPAGVVHSVTVKAGGGTPIIGAVFPDDFGTIGPTPGSYDVRVLVGVMPGGRSVGRALRFELR